MSYNKLGDSNIKDQPEEGEEKPLMEKDDEEKKDEELKNQPQGDGEEEPEGSERKQLILNDDEPVKLEEDEKNINDDDKQILDFDNQSELQKKDIKQSTIIEETKLKEEKITQQQQVKLPPQKRKQTKKRNTKRKNKISPQQQGPPSEDEPEVAPESGITELQQLMEEEVKLIQQDKENAEQIRQQRQQDRIKSVANQRRHREWQRYYELRGKQYQYHLPEPEGWRAWDSLNIHQKYVYCTNLLPDLGKKKYKCYKKWSTEVIETEEPIYYQFDIVCRFWFLCQTYSLQKHVFNPYYKDKKTGKRLYYNGVPVLYGRKILFQNMTISFSPWNHYWHSSNYVADLWSDVDNFTFTLFRKGKRAFHYDQYVRDHNDFMKEAVEDVKFTDEYGWDIYNKIQRQTQKKMYYYIEKQVPEKEYISKPDDSFTRPAEAQEETIWLQQDPPKQYYTKFYYLTDFSIINQFKNFKTDQKRDAYLAKMKEEYENSQKIKIEEDKKKNELQQQEKLKQQELEQEKKKQQELEKQQREYYYYQHDRKSEKEKEKFEEQKKKEEEEYEKRQKEEDEEEKKLHEEDEKITVSCQQYREYAQMLIKRKKRESWKNFFADPIIEQLAQYNFWIDREMIMTRIGAYLPSYTIPNYHQEFISKFKESMPRQIIRHKLSKFTIFYRAIQAREFKWPQKPRLDIPYPKIINEYNPNCKFIMFNRKKDRDDIYFKFGKITWNRFYMEVRYPWTILNAFGMGLSAIKHFYIIHGKYG